MAVAGLAMDVSGFIGIGGGGKFSIFEVRDVSVCFISWGVVVDGVWLVCGGLDLSVKPKPSENTPNKAETEIKIM